MADSVLIFITGILKADFEDLASLLPEIKFSFFENNLAIAKELLIATPAAIILHPKVNAPDGCALINYMRTSADSLLNGMPIVAIFHEEDGLEHASLKAGANACITYPFDLEKVQTTINQLLLSRTKLSAIPYVDLNYLHEVAGNDVEFVQEMIDTFLKKNEEYLMLMEKWLQEKNWVELGNITHKAKSSYALLGIFSLQVTAALMENNANTDRDEKILNQLFGNIQLLSKYAMEELRR